MLTLSLTEKQDARAVLDFFIRNRQHLAPWIPLLSDEFYTVEYHSRRIEQYWRRYKTAEEFRFLVWDAKTVVATINLTAIEYGAFLNGRLGYSVDAEYVGRGIATEYIGLVCEYGFEKLGLHRIEANVMPVNAASKRVLEKLGFSLIGRSPKMVKIAGRWEDHDMYAKIWNLREP